MTENEIIARIAGLETARSEAVSLRAVAYLRGGDDSAQRRMATRIINRIDDRIAELRERLDAVDCWSEDNIDKGLLA